MILMMVTYLINLKTKNLIFAVDSSAFMTKITKKGIKSLTVHLITPFKNIKNFTII